MDIQTAKENAKNNFNYTGTRQDFSTMLATNKYRSAMNTLTMIQREEPKYKNFITAYEQANYLQDNAQYIYRNTKDPREETNAVALANIITKMYPNISFDEAKQNYRQIMKAFTGDEMDATNLVEVWGKRAWNTTVSLAQGVGNYFRLFGWQAFGDKDSPEAQEKWEQYKKELKASVAQQQRTDYYNETFDSWIEQCVLDSADIIPSSVFSLTPLALGYTLSFLTQNPGFAIGGHVLSGVTAGILEAGSASIEALNAGLDEKTALVMSSCIGLANGVLEYVGNIPDALILNNIFKVTAGGGARTISREVAKWASHYAMNLVMEPITEVAQEWVSMYGQNLAIRWEENNLGKSFDEEFKFSKEEMIEAMKQVALQTFRGEVVLGLTGAGFEALSSLRGIGPQVTKTVDINGKKTQVKQPLWDAGEIRQIMWARKYQNYSKGSVTMQGNRVITPVGAKSNINIQKDANGNPTSKIDSVKTIKVGNIYLPINDEEMNKAEYMKANSKNGYMYIEVVNETDVSNLQFDKATNMQAEALAGLMSNKDDSVFVNENGEIQVNPEDYESAVQKLFAMLGDNVEAVVDESDGKVNKVGIIANGKEYIISNKISNGNAVTKESLLKAMKLDEGNKIYASPEEFGTQIRAILEKNNYNGDIDKAVTGMTEWVKKNQNIISKLAQNFEGINADQYLGEKVIYGTAAMMANLASLLDLDMDWVANNVVIDDTLGVGRPEKGVKDYGYSYWTDKDGNKISEGKIDSDSQFHITLTELVDQTTGIHEVGHMALTLGKQKFLQDENFRKAFRKELEADNKIKDKDGKEILKPESEWTIGDETQEAFAKGLEKYVDTGVAENSEQAGIFKRILNALKAFYDSIRDALSPEKLEYYDRLFGNIEEETEADIETETTETQTSTEETEDEDDAEVRYKREKEQLTQVQEMQEYIDNHPEIYRNEQGQLLAPNGEVSNLDAYTYALVRTPYFLRWFGDWINDPENASVILDNNGEPKIVYHHTEDTSFDTFMIGTGNYYVNGMYFMEYSGNNTGYGDESVNAFLNIRNPYYIGRDISMDETVKKLYIDTLKEKFIPRLKYEINLYPDMFDTSKERMLEYVNTLEERLNKAYLKYPTDILKETTGFASHIYMTPKGKKMISDLCLKANKVFTDVTGIDGFVVDYKGWYIALQPNQIKSTDNNGEFSTEDVRYRHKREFELRSLEDDMKNGKPVSFYELNFYRNQTDWVQAEYTASKLATDGSMQWMSTLLENIVSEQLGDKDFAWNQITDEDWAEITKKFKEQAPIIEASRFKGKSFDEQDKFRKNRVMDKFDGKDVTKVLMRLLAWDLNTEENSKLRNWIHQFTGRDGKANDNNILKLARRMQARGEFGDKVKYSDGTYASKKYRFLDMVQQTAYGDDKNKNYRTTRVGEVYYEGALAEIEKYANELSEIDQTVGLDSKGKLVKKEMIDEETGDKIKYSNVTERDVNKARAQAKNEEMKRKQTESEIKEIEADNKALKEKVNEILTNLQQAAKELGIEPDQYTTINGLIDAVKETGKDISEFSELMQKYNAELGEEYERRIAENNDKVAQLKSDLRIQKQEYHTLEMKNRKADRDIKRLTEKLNNATKQITEDRQISKEDKKKLTANQKEIDSLLAKIEKMEAADERLKAEHDATVEDLRNAYKDISKLTRENKSLDKQNEKLRKQSKLDLAVIKQLDENITSVLKELKEVVKIKERVQAELWRRNEDVKALRERQFVDNSKRKMKAKLQSKGGDATMDKAMSTVSKIIFSRPDEDGNFKVKAINKNLIDSIPNIKNFLTANGFLVDGKIVKGIADLPLGKYKDFLEAISFDRELSTKTKKDRVTERKEKATSTADAIIQNLTPREMKLTSKEKKQAREEYLDGKYASEELAQKALLERKLLYEHEGTQTQRDNKKKLRYSGKIDLTNNVLVANFLSLDNLMYHVSPQWKEAFFFGDGNMIGIEKVYDNFYTELNKRMNVITEYFEKRYGNKGYQKWLKESQKKITTYQFDLTEERTVDWLEKQQTFINFRDKVKYVEGFADNSLTVANLLAIYEHAHQNEDLAHILKGGSVDAAQLAWIVNEFEKEDGVLHKYKEIADLYQSVYESAFDRMAKIANDLYGIAMTRYDFYSPARAENQGEDISLQFAFDLDGDPVDRGKKLTYAERSDMQLKRGGANAISLEYVSDLPRIVKSQEWFIAGAEFFKHWNDVMKNEGGKLRDTVDKNNGTVIANTIMKLMKSISNSSNTDLVDDMNNFVSILNGNRAVASLGLNLSSAMVQPAVLPYAVAMFKPSNFFSSFSTISREGGLKGFFKYVFENAPQIRASSDITLAYAQKRMTTIADKLHLPQSAVNATLAVMKAMDRFSRCMCWEAGYRYYLSKGFSVDDAKLRATHATLEINTSTQAKDNPLIYNSKSPWWKMILMFTNQSNKNFNLLVGEHGIEGAIKEKQFMRAVSTLCAFGVSTTYILMVKGKFFHNNKDEDEEWWEDLGKDYFAQGVSIVPYIGDKISDALSGYNYIDTDVFQTLVNTVNAISTEDDDKRQKKIRTSVKNLISDTLEVTGGPKVLFQNTYRTFFKDGEFAGDEFFTNGRWTGFFAPSEWFEVITGEEL